MANLITNNRNDVKFFINEDEYWDFYIHKGDNVCKPNRLGNNISTECLISYIDFLNENCIYDTYVSSLYDFYYDCCRINKTVLENIGFCGVDNGIIRFERDRITNKQFLDIFTNSKLYLDYSCRLKLYEVSGNTKQYDYSTSYDEEGVKLNGGFFQGFFMTDENEYQVLPNKLDDVWHFEFTLKKENFSDTKENILNNSHKDNEGMFFYIGTRAENKWMLLYDESILKECSEYVSEYDDGYFYNENYNRTDADYIRQLNYVQEDTIFPYVIDGYFSEISDDKPFVNLEFIKGDYVDFQLETLINKNCLKDKGEVVKVGTCRNIPDECVGYLNYKNCNCGMVISSNNGYPSCDDGNNYVPFCAWRCDFYSQNSYGNPHNFVENPREHNRDRFWRSDDSSRDNNKNTRENSNNNNFIGYKLNEQNSDWLQKDAFDLDKEIYSTDENYFQSDIDISDFEYETDNGIKLHLNEYYIESDNKFLLFNRTCNGYTIKDWEEGAKALLIFPKNEFKGNLFLLMNRTCTGYTINNIDELRKEPYKDYDYKKDLYDNALGFRITEDGRIGYRYLTKDCEKNDIKIIEYYSKPFIKENEWYTINIKLKKYMNEMRIFIYVNGKLVLCSQFLPLLKLRKLDEMNEKQESVPYNISVGGGTQGLAEVILPNYMMTVDKVYPLEQYFAGTFIGHIKSFRFYDCLMEQRIIENNFIVDKDLNI